MGIFLSKKQVEIPLISIRQMQMPWRNNILKLYAELLYLSCLTLEQDNKHSDNFKQVSVMGKGFYRGHGYMLLLIYDIYTMTRYNKQGD